MRVKKEEVTLEQAEAQIFAYEQLIKEGYFDDIIKLSEMNILTIHFREKPTERQKYHIWVVPGFHIGLMRNLKAKAIPPYPIAARLMTAEEVEREKLTYRNRMIGYASWEECRRYEMKQYSEKDWMDVLDQLKTEYPCSKSTYTTKKGQVTMIL